MVFLIAQNVSPKHIFFTLSNITFSVIKSSQSGHLDCKPELANSYFGRVSSNVVTCLFHALPVFLPVGNVMKILVPSSTE
jgi:hypothetical protein